MKSSKIWITEKNKNRINKKKKREAAIARRSQGREGFPRRRLFRFGGRIHRISHLPIPGWHLWLRSPVFRWFSRSIWRRIRPVWEDERGPGAAFHLPWRPRRADCAAHAVQAPRRAGGSFSLFFFACVPFSRFLDSPLFEAFAWKVGRGCYLFTLYRSHWGWLFRWILRSIFGVGIWNEMVDGKNNWPKMIGFNGKKNGSVWW